MDRSHVHPSAQDLMLYVDGELGDRQAEKIRRHLASCWECRTHLAQIESTIVEFVNLRRRALDHQISHSDSQPSRALLAARLTQATSSAKPGFWQLMRPSLNGAWIGAAMAISLAVWLLLPVFFPPRVSANEVLAHVEAAETRPSPGALIHQRVRVRRMRMKPVSDAAVDYDMWTSAKRSRVIPASLQPGPGVELQAIYEKCGARFDSPLSGESFAKLRESMDVPHDEVSGSNFITLTSTPTGAAHDVQRIEFMIRRSDWHPLAQRIHLVNEEYDVTELLHEVVPPASVDAALFGEPVAASKGPVPATRIAAPEPAPILPGLPADEQLEDAEIRLREALHQSHADVQEVAEIERRSGEIHLRLWAQTAIRKNEILRSLDGIPYLSTEIYDAENSAGDPPPTVAQAPVYTTRPPLAEALWKYLGGVDPANRYLDQVRDSYLLALKDAGALDRLTRRYPTEQWSRLPADLRIRLDNLAADHIRALRENLAAYRETLSPVLDKMLEANHLRVNETDPPRAAGCDSWREVAPNLLADLRRLQTAFWRLFVEERLEAPITLSTDEVLRESAQSRSQLIKESNRLCLN